jgi:hypothetical protein
MAAPAATHISSDLGLGDLGPMVRDQGSEVQILSPRPVYFQTQSRPPVYGELTFPLTLHVLLLWSFSLPNIADEIRQISPGLFGGKVVEDEYHAESFGDSKLILDFIEFKLRLVRDRGQFMVHFAPAGLDNKWLPITRVWDIASLQPPHVPDWPDAVIFLQKNFDEFSRKARETVISPYEKTWP